MSPTYQIDPNWMNRQTAVFLGHFWLQIASLSYRRCQSTTFKLHQAIPQAALNTIVLGLTLTTWLIECSKSSAPYIWTIYLHVFPVVCNFLNRRSGPYHLNIRTELVFHTTSEPDCPGPATTYLNVITVYKMEDYETIIEDVNKIVRELINVRGNIALKRNTTATWRQDTMRLDLLRAFVKSSNDFQTYRMASRMGSVLLGIGNCQECSDLAFDLLVSCYYEQVKKDKKLS